MDDEELFAFDRSDSRKLLSLISAGGGRVPLPADPRLPTEGLIVIALAPAGGIPAATLTAASSGTVTFLEIDDDGTYITTDVTDTAWHLDTSGGVGANKKLILVRDYIRNRWLIAWEMC